MFVMVTVRRGQRASWDDVALCICCSGRTTCAFFVTMTMSVAYLQAKKCTSAIGRSGPFNDHWTIIQKRNSEILNWTELSGAISHLTKILHIRVAEHCAGSVRLLSSRQSTRALSAATAAEWATTRNEWRLMSLHSTESIVSLAGFNEYNDIDVTDTGLVYIWFIHCTCCSKLSRLLHRGPINMSPFL